jgi:hypothetical protein
MLKIKDVEIYILLGCGAMSLGHWYKMFRANVVISKRRTPITERRGATTQRNGGPNYTDTKDQNVTSRRL